MNFDVEQFFQSIDIILTQRLSDLSYDTTVIATIVDDSDKNKGKYIVSDGTIKFDAYSNDTTYQVDDQVRVAILNGDWSQKKFIEGKYVEKNNTSALTYIPPLGTTMQDNQSTLSTFDDWTLYANYSSRQNIWAQKISQDSEYYTLQTNGIYNVITLQGDFQTNLGTMAAGNYGLLLELFIQPEVGSNARIRKFITFDSSEMIGNPYSFVIDSHQSKQIIIASEGIVTEIILSLYQGQTFDIDNNGDLVENPNYFIDKSGNELPHIEGQNPIHFRNIVLGFGSDLTEVQDNSLQLYTTSSATYHWNEGVGDETNNKNLGIVWYNKDENDGYVGYSDGIYDLDYDEIEYLEQSYADSRLLNQKGKTGIPTDELSLTLAANIVESEPFLTKTYEALTTDLSQVLQSMGRQIGGTGDLLEKLNQLIMSHEVNGETKKAKLVEYHDTAETATQDLVKLYKNILQYGYDIQNNNETSWDETWDAANYDTVFINAINNALNIVEDFLDYMDQETSVGKSLSGYRGVYDSYHLKVKKQMTNIKVTFDQIIFNTNGTSDVAHLKSYKNKTDYIPYAETDLSDYDNKYCIYWYRYNQKYNLDYIVPREQGDNESNSDYNNYLTECEINNREYKFAQFLGKYWERVQVDKDNSPIQNFGLPKERGETIDDIVYYPSSPNSAQILQRFMSPTAEEERYQVVLFYNHTMIKSNIITFTNTEAEKIPNEFRVDAGDALRIDHGSYSQDHYQAYTSAFDLVNIADESRSRQLRVSYDGVLVGDEALAGAGIYWYIPTNSTMLTFDKKYLIEDLNFNSDIDEATTMSRNGFVYFYKQIGYTEEEIDATDIDGNVIYKADGTAAKDTKITITELDRQFAYKIKPYYENSATNNTILVEVHIPNPDGGEKVTTGEISFTFSTFGSNGTKYSLTLVPSSTQIAVLGDSALGLTLALRNADGELLTLSETAIEDTSLEDEILTYALDVDWYTKNKNAGGIALEDIANSKEKAIEIANATDDNKYAGIVQATVQYRTAGRNEQEDRIIKLSTLYPVPFSSGRNYYISGPTSIVYNNQGSVSRLSEEPFKLYSRYVDTGEVDQDGNKIFDENVEIENQKWILAYYDSNGNLVGSSDDNLTNSSTYSEEDRKAIMAYMPTLNSDNTLMPAPMYYTYPNDDFYVPVAICKLGTRICWTQPIIITQNQYASSTLNDWNGQFEINEENGTILSTMLGAGKKTDNNTFEGVLIGDIEAGANFDKHNADGIGIYGFNDGAQSFYFGVNGKAFIGKAGRGRIHFNGNEGKIQSASYENNSENESGMMIDLDDGTIEMKGTAEYVEEDWETLKANNPDKYGEFDSYEDYVERYGKIYKSDAKQSLIKLDVKSPYFKIHSANQTDKNKYIMYVSDSDYYLETDDYQTTTFDTSTTDIDAKNLSDGKGMRIDLREGAINAYRFTLTSKNIFLDAGDNAETYLSIRDNNGKVLFYVGDDNYFLKSSDFRPLDNNTSGNLYPGMGTKINLTTGSIEAYDFNLRAGNYELTDTNGNLTGYGHVLTMTTNGTSETNPFLKITDTDGNKLMVVTNSSFYLQSSTYSSTSGFKIDVDKGQILANGNFTLKATKAKTGEIIISTDEKDYPLQVNGTGDNSFKVNWNGALEATGATITGTINATGGHFTGTVTVDGVIDGAEITGGEIYGAVIANAKENATFSVNTEGHLVANSAEIGGWNVSPENISSANGGFTLDPLCGISSKNFNTLEDGTITASNAIFNNLTVYKSLTVIAGDLPAPTSIMPLAMVSQPSYSIMDGGGSSAGAVANPVVSITGETQLGGDIQIDGTTLMGGDSTVTGNLDVQATTKVNNDIYFGGNIHCTLAGGTDATGVSGTFSLDGAGIFDDVYMKFEKGILVGFTDPSGDNTAAGGSYLPSIEGVASGKVLTVTGTNTLGWAYIKKKFNVTMSGEATVNMDGYYTRSGPYTGYKVTDVAAYARRYRYYYTVGSTIYGPVASLPQTYDDYKGFYEAYDDGVDYVRNDGSFSYYVTTDAADKKMSVTLKGTSAEITLDGGSTTDGSIDITITGATAS